MKFGSLVIPKKKKKKVELKLYPEYIITLYYKKKQKAYYTTDC